MIIELMRGGRKYSVDLGKGVDCSSTLGDPKREPAAWYVDPVSIQPVRMGDWIGSVAEGGSVNFFEVKLNPHGNGTHTECYGHIDKQQQKVGDLMQEHHGWLYFQRLPMRQEGEDLLLKLEDLKIPEEGLPSFVALAADGLAFPKNFSNTNPPYFEAELCRYLAEAGVSHLLTNLPSVDREEDGGALAAHRAFWQYPKAIRKQATITELAHFPDELMEGIYFVNLQLAPLHNDAAPSRPVFYPIIKE
ncbi:cyclase family protein [Croceimicrobium sp.]|uniref:cyclase family protein n=1 Tax=Croceimicrobium sp. TaxID=2828340 RepID=UPI003BAB109F